MTKEEDERPVRQWPQISAENWQAMAIAGGLIALILSIAGALWMLNAESTDILAARARAFAPLAALMIAAVTFCTVVWRGKISERQADLQQAQVVVSQEQVVATREQNLAEMLQKGAELISATSEPGKVMAGVISLEAVSTDPNGKFAVQAMNILADFLQLRFSKDHRHQSCAATISALKTGSQAQRPGEPPRIANRALFFDANRQPDAEAEETVWSLVTGAAMVTYTGGKMRSVNFTKDNIAATTEHSFVGVEFLDGLVDARKAHLFGYCTFKNVRIVGIDFDTVTTNKFLYCDFSGCVLDTGEFYPWESYEDEFPDLRSGGNYFDPAHPPITDDASLFGWSKKLHVGKQGDDL